jgi:hypothetical protein
MYASRFSEGASLGSNGFEATGLLARDGSVFALHSDDGQVWQLSLPRIPVDLVEKSVRIVGSLETGNCVEVEGIAPFRPHHGDLQTSVEGRC